MNFITYFYTMKARLRDGMNYLGKLNIPRIKNAFLVFVGYYWSRLSRNPRPWGLPLSISVEPTTACNLGCPECPSGLKQFTRATGNIKMPLFDKILEEIGKTTSYMIFYFQGEPYIHPGLFEMIQKASAKGIYTATSTNAHFINESTARKTVESGLDRLIISIDGSTQEVYESYRIHGELSKVIEGTKEIVKQKKILKSSTPHVIFQCLVVKPNEHQIDEIKALAKKLGVNEVRFKTAQLYDFEKGNELMPSNSKYNRYRETSPGNWEIKNNLDNHCWRMWHSCVITQNGAVVPCCFDKDAEHELGDITAMPFQEIWNHERYLGFRTQLLKSRKEIDICRNCSEGTKVWS